ncbi:coagulation factor XIII A chain-like [Hydractinia symbiolongicarpus]|uniref:coagulation factor XIII A chain-like n=1 Tax=Hydractinia symbiolongicarpus TaxID=13093 RepID=UPI002549ECD9|nr:coagulation factor XIII A chain-like [Hydractinia symbiolongicarpus]
MIKGFKVYNVNVLQSNSDASPNELQHVSSSSKNQKSFVYPMDHYFHIAIEKQLAPQKNKNRTKCKTLTIFDTRGNFCKFNARSAFTITRVDTQDHHNRKLHHTDQYKSKALILRRGQDFILDVYPSTSFDNSNYKFYIELWTGRKPREFDRTLIKIRMVKYLERKRWGMKRTGTHDTKIQLKINIPSTCIIGKYQMRILNMNDKVIYRHEEPLFMLFNPWSTDDEVYMPNTSDLDEYVLNDQGVLFQGSSGHISPLRWYLGQFENVALEVLFELLKTTSIRRRDSAREIARRISAFVSVSSVFFVVFLHIYATTYFLLINSQILQVNANDEGGIIAGRWSGDYSGGVEPWAWTGSPAMLEQYMRTNKPVKYGQCWNFCGVATTLLRAIGIPTRAISNFNSAHDTDANCTYDRYYDENGEYISKLSTDSTWNFHCWNDVWMERPDLPPGYGGWQAVDATPQERSQGIFQLGPAPLRAVKEGNVNMKYDVRFVFAEVNADTVYWGKIDADDEFRPVRVDRKLIGQNISTKAIGPNTFNRVDISEEYKYPEGSALELATVKRALHLSNNKIIKDTSNDLDFSLTTEPHVSVGSDIKLRLSIRNTAARDLSTKVMIGGHIVMYNGMSLDKIAVKKSDVKVNRKGGEICFL